MIWHCYVVHLDRIAQLHKEIGVYVCIYQRRQETVVGALLKRVGANLDELTTTTFLTVMFSVLVHKSAGEGAQHHTSAAS